MTVDELGNIIEHSPVSSVHVDVAIAKQEKLDQSHSETEILNRVYSL